VLIFAFMSLRINWDVLGVTTSLACAIHCAVLPMVLTSLPIFGINIVNNTAFEYFMILLALFIGCCSLWHGYRKHHHNFMPLLVFFLGGLLLFAKQIWHTQQFWLLLFAIIFIITAHLFNCRSCRVQNPGHGNECEH
jgi:MerC mercury resistance protein